MPNQPNVIFIFTEILCITLLEEEYPVKAFTLALLSNWCAHVLLGWNVVSVDTKSVWRETARKKGKDGAVPLRLRSFFCTYKSHLHITFKYWTGLGFFPQVQLWTNIVRTSSYSSKIAKFSNCIWICLESSTLEGNLPFPFGFLFVCFNKYVYL